MIGVLIQFPSLGLSGQIMPNVDSSHSLLRPVLSFHFKPKAWFSFRPVEQSFPGHSYECKRKDDEEYKDSNLRWISFDPFSYFISYLPPRDELEAEIPKKPQPKQKRHCKDWFCKNGTEHMDSYFHSANVKHERWRVSDATRSDWLKSYLVSLKWLGVGNSVSSLSRLSC